MNSHLRHFSQKVANVVKKPKDGGNHARIFRGMITVAFFLFIGKIAGAAKEMVVAYRFGVSETVDLYTLTFTVTGLLPMVWTTVLATVFVPLAKKLSEQERSRFCSQLSGLSFILGLFFSGFVAVFVPMLVPYIWSDLSLLAQEEYQGMLRGLAPTIFAMFMASQYAAQLLAIEQHSNTLMDALPPLILTVVLLLLVNGNGVHALIVGSLLGYFAQVIGLRYVLKLKDSIPRLSFKFDSPSWGLFRNAIGIMTVGQLIIGFVIPIDLYFASKLGTGEVASYGYAQRILFLGMGLGATAVGRAILPVLSDINTNAEKRALALRWCKMLLALGAVAAAVLWLVSPYLVRLLFERGAFTAEDTQNVAHIIRCGLLQLPVYFAGIVLVQLFASQSNFKIIFYSSVVAIFAKLIFAWLGSHWFGLPGIMVSAGVMYTCTLLFLWYSVNEKRQVS